MLIIGTNQHRFMQWHKHRRTGKFNGSYFYANEIENIILPKIKSDLTIVTCGATLINPRQVPNGSAIVCHDNRDTVRNYQRFFNKDILWICSKESTVQTLKDNGENAVYIPLSIDTKYVRKFKRKKAERTEELAFVGNAWNFKKTYLNSLPKDVQQLSDLPRDELLTEMSKYKRVIAEGRCLMEAQILGAKGEVPQYTDLEAVFVEPLDTRDAIPMWKEVIEAHDRRLKHNTETQEGYSV